MLNHVTLYCFSPTGGTRHTAELFCQSLAETVSTVDLTTQTTVPAVSDAGAAVIAAPVFGGRLPSPAAERLRSLNGNGKPAVTLAVYGNRAYEDALLELNDITEQAGFHVIASAALIARHSLMPEVAEGRPDARDSESLRVFAQNVLTKLETNPDGPITVPGNRPYKPIMPVPAVPVTLPSCNLCGKCAEACPVGAIALDKGSVQTGTDCIQCAACITVCPEKARILPPPLQEKLEQMLSPLKTVRRENEYFL